MKKPKRLKTIKLRISTTIVELIILKYYCIQFNKLTIKTRLHRLLKTKKKTLNEIKS